MLCLFTGASLGLLGAVVAGMLGATWGQIFLTYIVIGIVMSLASGLLLIRNMEGKADDLIPFPGHGDGAQGHGMKRLTRSDHVN